MTFCGRCGEKNPDDARFCWKCGAMLLHEPERAEGVRDGEHVHRPARDPRGDINAQWGPKEADTVPKAAPRTEEAPRISQDPRLKDGYTLIDERTVGFGGKRYSIDPQDISNYKTGAVIIIIITYILAFYFVFAYEFTYDVEIGEVGFTLYDICTGDNSFKGPVQFMFWLMMILFICGFVPFCTAVGCIVAMFLTMFISVFATNVDLGIIEVGVPLEMVPEAMFPAFCLIIAIMIPSYISGWLQAKATMPATMVRNVGTFAALASFYTGRKY